MENFLVYIAKSAGFIASFYLCYRVFLQKETFFVPNRYFLSIGILLSVVLPFLTIRRVVDVVPVKYALSEANENPAVREIAVGPDIWSVVFWLYMAGVIFFAGRLAMQLLSLKRFLSGCEKYKQDDLTMVRTTRYTTPFSFFNLVVYNPAMYPDQGELNTILEHEKVHVTQKHSLDVILVQLLAVFQWCNPLVWLYKKAVAENLEYLADQHAVQKSMDKKDYQYLLLRQTSTYMRHMPVTNTFFNSSIKKRVVMLNKNNSSRKQLWKYGIAIPVLTVFLLAVNTETVAQEKVENDKAKMQKALVVIDEKVSKRSDLDNLDERSISDMSVLKGEGAHRKYGEKGKNGVIEVFTKGYREKHPKVDGEIKSGDQYPAKYDKIKSSSGDGATNIKTSTPWKVSAGVQPVDGKQPRIVVDGEMKEKGFDINTLDLSKIDSEKSILLKAKEAVEKYGENGVDGVLEMYAKNE